MLDNLKRDFTQNFARLEDSSADDELRPLFLTENGAAVAKKINKWAEQEPRWTVVEVTDAAEGTHIHLTRTTRWLRFVDDIRVVISPHGEAGSTRLDAESQSRLGKGDLGQNPRNLKMLRQGILASD